MSLHACLPAELRGPATTITKIAAGLSGAGVYRVEAGGQAYVLKVSDPAEPLAAWLAKTEIQRLAAREGVAPGVVHTDDATRAVVSEHVVDQSFGRLLAAPATRDDAIATLGRTLRRVHDLPLPAGSVVREGREVLSRVWAHLAAFPVPAFVGEAVRRVLDRDPPPPDRPAVLSHNDVNPTNLVYDGQRLLLLDWDVAGMNDPLYDLATIAVFLRMDEASCLRLIAVHDGAAPAQLPARFTSARVLVAVMCGTVFLHLARAAGHAGTASATLEATASLAEVYPLLQSGEVNLATGDGRWRLGLGLIKDSFAL